MGMAHVPEGRRVFADMSVYENLLMGAYTRKDKNEIAQSLEMVYRDSRVCKNVQDSVPVHFPVVSSRCLQWAVR